MKPEALATVYSLPKEPLSDFEASSLIFVIEEEKLARDVYMTLYKIWGVKTFGNIALSEVTHMQMVQALLEKYNLEFKYSDEIGVFQNDELKKLYEELVEKGSKSLKDAYEVGTLIEDKDIYDLEEYLKKVDNHDLIFVFENLIKGSENHMRAFDTQLYKITGQHYKAQFITQERLEKILSQGAGSGKGK